MKCRKCDKEIKIHGLKQCYWCPDCRLRGPAVNEDAVVESQGGITMNMVRETCQAMIDAAMGPKVDLTGLTEDKDQELKDEAAKIEEDKLWRENAKAYGVPVYDFDLKRPRKKADVLAELADKMNSPEKPDANEIP
jgi:hypothetical protein